MNAIAWVVLAALLLDFGLNWMADHLNLKSQPDTPPEAFKPFFKNGDYQRSRRYLRVNTRFDRLNEAIQLAAVLIFWFGGGFPALDAWVRTFQWGPILSGLVFIGVLAALRFLLSLPFSLYHTFVIEARFGFGN